MSKNKWELRGKKWTKIDTYLYKMKHKEDKSENNILSYLQGGDRRTGEYRRNDISLSTAGPLYLRVPHLQIQSNADCKYSEKNSRKFQKGKL